MCDNPASVGNTSNNNAVNAKFLYFISKLLKKICEIPSPIGNDRANFREPISSSRRLSHTHFFSPVISLLLIMPSHLSLARVTRLARAALRDTTASIEIAECYRERFVLPFALLPCEAFAFSRIRGTLRINARPVALSNAIKRLSRARDAAA